MRRRPTTCRCWPSTASAAHEHAVAVAQSRGPASRCSAMAQTRRRVVAGLAALAAGTGAAYAVCGPAAVGVVGAELGVRHGGGLRLEHARRHGLHRHHRRGRQRDLQLSRGRVHPQRGLHRRGPDRVHPDRGCRRRPGVAAARHAGGAGVERDLPLRHARDLPVRLRQPQLHEGHDRGRGPRRHDHDHDEHLHDRGRHVDRARGPGAGRRDARRPAGPRRRPRARGSAWLIASAARCCAAR